MRSIGTNYRFYRKTQKIILEIYIKNSYTNTMPMKLSDYAKKYGITYKTAWNRFKAGKIKGAYKDETEKIIKCLKQELQNADQSI